MVIVFPFVLLWGEIFTHILLPQNVDSKMNIFATDLVVGFTYKPKATTYEKGREYNALYQINSLGLRDREYGLKKGNIFRVILVGDSFSVSHGLPIEESLSRQMERALQKIADKENKNVEFEVINAAVGGYSPFNYWEAYRRWAPVFKPDAVLVGLSPDDYDCDNANSQYLIEDGEMLGFFKDGQIPSKKFRSSMKKWRKWLSWNSQFYILLRNFLYYNDIVGRLSLLISAKDESRTFQLQQFMVPQPKNMTKAWATSFSYLEKLKKETTADKVPMIIIPIPLKEEIDHKIFQVSLLGAGLNQDQADINLPLNQISIFCKERDIPLLDPRPALKARHAKKPCYFIYDGHWIGEGIRVATEYVAKQWRESALAPWDKSNLVLQSGNIKKNGLNQVAIKP
jgi:hypothetical protein